MNNNNVIDNILHGLTSYTEQINSIRDELNNININQI